jgi:hypothetical protein
MPTSYAVWPRRSVAGGEDDTSLCADLRRANAAQAARIKQLETELRACKAQPGALVASSTCCMLHAKTCCIVCVVLDVWRTSRAGVIVSAACNLCVCAMHGWQRVSMSMLVAARYTAPTFLQPAHVPEGYQQMVCADSPAANMLRRRAAVIAVLSCDLGSGALSRSGAYGCASLRQMHGTSRMLAR